ncbi:MAG: hypothetical protein M0R80_21665, partial [Proteobacteria bacterium]|nr:hypothetical protein [Pseudomonadota bacterium]
MKKVAIFSCVGGGPMERLVRSLEAGGQSARTESLFSPERWRDLMHRGPLGRAAARAGAMGVFPARTAIRAAFLSDRFLVPTTNPFFLPLVLVATGAWHGRRVVPLVYDLYPDAWEATGVTKAAPPA